ncbi:MAG: FkbM family methyltransferase [Chloroflexota bacterium]
MIKELVKQGLKKFGLELRALNSPTRSFSNAVAQLKKEIYPQTIIDIGVAEGTPDLYEQYPNHPYLLVEANPAYQPALESLQKQLNAIVETVFCGEKKGETAFNIYEDPRKSSSYEISRNLTLKEQKTVPVETLDSLIEKHALTGPFLLKIDVEGAEIDVIKGATQTLQACEAIIAEASILPKLKDGPEFADLVTTLHAKGFSVFDIAAGSNHQQSGKLLQVDLIFVKTEAKFRQIN